MSPTLERQRVSVHVLSGQNFETQCRIVFKPYTLAAGGKPHQLDPRFRTFIAANRGRSGVERAEILDRLKLFDLSSVAESHTPKLGRDRYDDLVRKLDWIAGSKPPQAEIDFGSPEKSA